MGKIRIIADSMSDIPRDLIKKLNIKVIPLTVRFGSEEFKDGVDLTGEEFYNKLELHSEVPSTSQIPPSGFLQAIEESIEEGYESIIIINGSSEVSGTHQSASLAKAEIQNDDVFVIDSRALSFGCGMIVVRAAEMACEGESISEIIKEVENMIKSVEHIFSVDTLKYLHKNGRLSTTSMALGTLLNVKPILTIKNGKVEPLDKVRGNKRVIKTMIELAKEKGLKQGSRVTLAHSLNIEGIESLKEELINDINLKDIIVSEIGCTIGSHTGPGTLAMFFINA